MILGSCGREGFAQYCVDSLAPTGYSPQVIRYTARVETEDLWTPSDLVTLCGEAEGNGMADRLG